MLMLEISNGNRTEWSTIQGVNCNLASDFKSAKLNLRVRLPQNCTTRSPLPINWVNNKMRETLELKIQYTGRYASYQCIISLSSTF